MSHASIAGNDPDIMTAPVLIFVRNSPVTTLTQCPPLLCT